VKGGRNHLADFPEKGLTDLSINIWQIFQMGNWRIKIKTTIQLQTTLYALH
jgi:hypothetical protein